MIKKIVSLTLLEVVAKVAYFARETRINSISDADFIDGVYVVNIVYDEFDKPFINDVVDEHIVARDLVYDVLKTVPVTRDDDMLLLFEVWSRQGINFDLSDTDLSTLFNAETITRGRRKIQNDDGLFLPSSVVVAKRRRINEELLREYYGGLR